MNTFSNENMLTKNDEDVLFKAVDVFKKAMKIPCTGHCPQSIDVPSVMETLKTELAKLKQ